MNKKGQDYDAIIKGAIGLIIIIPVLIAFLGAISQITNQSQNTEVQKITAEKDQKIQNLEAERNKSQTEADFYKNKYETLVNTSVTKEDVVSIQGDLQVLKSQVGGLQNRTDMVNQNIVNFYNIKNTYFYFTISLVINFTLLSLAVFDWAFLNFAISENIMKRMRKLLESLKNKIKGIFKKKEAS